MKIDIDSGRMLGVKFALSPNHDDRPDETDICGIVIHNISLPPQQYGGSWIEDFFLNQLDYSAHPYFERLKELKVSAHILIKRTGEVIQFVPFQKRAWHAGISSWQGRERCNDFTIGIELEGCDNTPFLAVQYRQCALLIQSLINTYPALNSERITGHQHIAPGRKTDPGPYFNWSYLQALVEYKR